MNTYLYLYIYIYIYIKGIRYTYAYKHMYIYIYIYMVMRTHIFFYLCLGFARFARTIVNFANASTARQLAFKDQ